MIAIDKETFGPWAIVTGASSGIGKEFARQVAASGLNLVLVARRLALLEDVGRELARDFGIAYRAVAVDLADPGFVETLGAATRDLEVGLLISNAGAGHPAAFLSLEADDLHNMVQLNALAHLRLIHHFGRQLARRGRGGVLLVSALGAKEGLPYMAGDGAAKAFVLSLGEALHVEFRKMGVGVTVLLPGGVETPVLGMLGLDAGSLPVKPLSVERCVSEGLAALNANRAICIPGRTSRIMSALTPRPLMTRMNGTMLAKAAAKKHPGAGSVRSRDEYSPRL
jgi:uncharacterized protein